MQFRLIYKGPLKSADTKDKHHTHEIRRYFHSQLKALWQQPPLEHRSG
jgi:hypothetical protein